MYLFLHGSEMSSSTYGFKPLYIAVGGAGFSSLASAVGGAGLSSLASAVGGAGLASTHISYSNTGALLWYSVLVPRPYPLHVGNYGAAYVMGVSMCWCDSGRVQCDGEERDVSVYAYQLTDQTKQSVFKVPSL